jgi:hypothetical protein
MPQRRAAHLAPKRKFARWPGAGGARHYVVYLCREESSNRGDYKYGHYMMILADCRLKIELEFFLSNPEGVLVGGS